MNPEKHREDDIMAKEVRKAESDTSVDSAVDTEAQHARIMAAQRKVDKRLFLWSVIYQDLPSFVPMTIN